VSDSDRFASIEALFMDVDGVLTDGTFIWSTSGEESKSFSFEDVMGLSRARQAGLTLGLISGEGQHIGRSLCRKAQHSPCCEGL
jgi:3-deoxy-D-manno-octulosonate 8-phosphate phosphatase (KDO 8-P phosphatase)